MGSGKEDVVDDPTSIVSNLFAATILPVVQKQHQLLVTLLLCNAAAMEALPIYLDKLFHLVVAVILSVTCILAFGETAEEAMTPIESTFSVDDNTKLDWEVIGKIFALGHSHILVYSGNAKNIIELLLVKSLLTI